MARLPNVVIDRIKTEVSLVRLVESQGYQPKKQGKDYALSCPFHDGDNEPSLIITPKSNLFHCFGCNVGGSVIDWIMKTQGVSFRHAVEILRNDHPPLAAVSTTPIKTATVPKLAAPVTENADDQAALRQVIDYYHTTLTQSPEALDYLSSRGLNHPELINHFTLGYANRTLGLRLPQKNRKAGKELREQLQRVGIYRDTGREHFNGSLVVPVIDERGVISEVYGRKLLGAKLRKGTAQHLYLPGPHAGVWNVDALKASKEIILCESLIDAMTFWVHGFRHVTASYGTSGFTDDYLTAFKTHSIKRVLIAYDRDKAGNAAADKLAEKLLAEGMDCFRVLFPKGMDANEYALTMSPSDKALGLVIRKAEWMGQGKAPGITTDKAMVVESVSVPQESQTCDLPPAPKPVEKIEPAPAIPEAQSSPIPDPPPAVEADITDHEIHLTFGDRVYRVRGLANNTNLDQLKINLLVRSGELFHTDKLDLYSSKQRQVFINQASGELGVSSDVVKTDLGKLLLALEDIQEQKKRDSEAVLPSVVTLSQDDKNAALALLKTPALLNRILTDFTQAGVVGEDTNKLVGYLACVSRKLDKPLAVMIQSSSAAGKSSLMESVLALMPEEERVQYSAMTGQSLFYMGETNLKHKILAIAEEEGASNASYALKLLQSEGEVTIASTGKDDTTGNLVTKEYTVQGPVMLFLTTTAIDIDEELLNRCLVLSVNESREQTRAIHAVQRQRRTLAGLQAKLKKEAVIELHRNAQRLLKPLSVINPYADQLTFLDDKTRTRRDHEKYLTLIDSIALLHQYQRDIKTITHNGTVIEYVEVTLDDIATANRLAHEVLGRSLDELPPQTRRLLTMITDHVNAECKTQGIEQSHLRFSRRQIRQLCGWSETQVRVHMQRLMDMEYLLTHRGGRGQSFEYELLYHGEGEAGDVFLQGLLDISSLKNNSMTRTSRGDKGQFAGPSRPQRGPVADQEKTLQTTADNVLLDSSRSNAESTIREKNNAASYPQAHRNDTAPSLAAGVKAAVETEV